MRILYFIPRCFPAIGGAEYFVHRLASAAATDGNPASVVARAADNESRDLLGARSTKGERSRLLDIGNYTASVIVPPLIDRGLLRIASRLRFYRETWSLAYQLFRQVYLPLLRPHVDQCEVVHSVLTGQNLYGFVLQELASSRGVPHVVTPFIHPGSWGDSDVDWRFYQMVDHLCVSTDFEAELVKSKGAVGGGISVVGMGCDPPRPSGEGRLTGQARRTAGRVVLFLGRKTPGKGYRHLLDAAPLVWHSHPDVRFVLVGPYEGDEHAYASCDPRIVDMPAMRGQAKEELLRSCDVLCLPSAAEAFGAVVLEAWTYGKPVVVGPAPALHEVVAEGVDGLWCDQTPQSIASRIVWLLDHPVEAAAMGAAGQRKALGSYTWRDVYTRILPAYSFNSASVHRAPPEINSPTRALTETS